MRDLNRNDDEVSATIQLISKSRRSPLSLSQSTRTASFPPYPLISLPKTLARAIGPFSFVHKAFVYQGREAKSKDRNPVTSPSYADLLLQFPPPIEYLDLLTSLKVSLGSSQEAMESASQFDHTDPSPPPAAGVRRHQSLNYPNAAGPKRMNALKRAGTLQTTPIKTHQSQGYSSGQSPSPTGAEEDGHEQEEESYFPAVQGNYPPSFGRSSPWRAPGTGNNDWRTPTGPVTPGSIHNMDDVSRALNTIELNQAYPSGNYHPSQPPRFNVNHPSTQQQNLRRGSQSGASTPGLPNHQGNGGRKHNPVTDVNDGRSGQGLPQSAGGPTSASAYMPAVGHGLSQRDNPELRGQSGNGLSGQRERALTASSAGQWEQRERVVVGRSSNPNLSGSYRNGGGNGGNNGIPNVPPIPPQFLNNQGQAPRLGQNPSNFGVLGGGGGQHGQNQSVTSNGAAAATSVTQFSLGSENVITSPMDVPTLLATKGYNPVDFDIKPPYVGFLRPSQIAID